MKIAIVDDSIKDREYLQKEIQEIFFRRTKNHPAAVCTLDAGGLGGEGT